MRRLATYLYDVEMHPWVDGGKLLDVGCGSGRYLQLMRALGWEITGVEYSEHAVRVAREAVGPEVHRGDVRDVAFSPDSFDAITLNHVLEHLADPGDALAELRRIASPGARLAIVVPNKQGLGARWFGRDWVGWDPRHFTYFSPDGLRIALERAGWCVEQVTTSSRGAHLFLAASAIVREGNDVQFAIDRAREDSLPGLERRKVRGLVMAERVARLLRRPVGEELFAVALRRD